MSKTYAYFFVAGFENSPEDISQKLNLQPTKTWRKGDEWLPLKTRTFDNWEIHSTASQEEIFLDIHIKSVLEIIEPKRKQILELQNLGYEMGINCVGYFYDEHPGFGLSSELITRIASLSLDIDFDLYCLCKESKADSD